MFWQPGKAGGCETMTYRPFHLFRWLMRRSLLIIVISIIALNFVDFGITLYGIFFARTALEGNPFERLPLINLVKLIGVPAIGIACYFYASSPQMEKYRKTLSGVRIIFLVLVMFYILNIVNNVLVIFFGYPGLFRVI
jgi:hypothetical protein